MKFKITLLVCLSVFLSGCIFAPILSSINESGVTEKGRQFSFNQSVKEFNSALFWQNYPKAQRFALTDSDLDIKSSLTGGDKNARVVEVKVEDVNFIEDSYTAEVSLALRIQEYETMIVAPKSQKQTWVYSLEDGWKIKTLSALEG
jgi:hypothetical protein